MGEPANGLKNAAKPVSGRSDIDTDERIWVLKGNSIDGSGFDTIDGPRCSRGQRIEVVPKARALAAEQRVAELEQVSAIHQEARGEVERDLGERVRCAQIALDAAVAGYHEAEAERDTLKEALEAAQSAINETRAFLANLLRQLHTNPTRPDVREALRYVETARAALAASVSEGGGTE